MPEYSYTARDESGGEVVGTLTAPTQREAVSLLGERDLFPMRVEEEKSMRRQWERRKRINSQTLAITLGQLADLLQSGVPLMRSLEVLARQASQPALAEVLTDIRDQVAEGETLDAALARHPTVFSDLTVSMVRAGGEGGFLEDVLKRTADFLESQDEMRSRAVGALIYPMVLAVVGFVATMVLIVFFVPKFAPMFERLEQRGTLPGMTTALLALSDFLIAYGLFILAGLMGLFIWLKRWLKTPRGVLLLDRVKLKVPLFGNIFLNLAVARFCRVLGTMLTNGVPILRGLEISSDSTGNRILAAAVNDAAANISTGQTLAGPLGSSGLFPQTVVEMISVAEESNTLEKVLVDIADGQERRTQQRLDMMVRLLEPAMLVMIAGAILFVVMALMLPVFEMSSTLD
jgi:general secretion pathway protein F/type IV pilus assembly protein PilC